MTVSIRVATSPGEARVAVVEGNRLLDYALWRPGAPDGVGDVHRGRVIGLVPAMAGAFVALSGGEGFLPDSEGAKGLTEGTLLTVRITRAAQGNKGPRLTARLDEPPSSGPVGLLRRGPDPVTRFASRYAGAPILVDNAGMAADLRLEPDSFRLKQSGSIGLCLRGRSTPEVGSTSDDRAVGARVSIVSNVFDEDVAEAVDALSRPVVELPGGIRLSIWPTPALVAIDVDGGGALRGGGNARARHETLNRSVLPALAAQIKLRNLSGGIVVDLAGLPARRRAGLAPDFAAALANDPLHPKLLGFTALGLAEIVRPRIHPPLHELLAVPLAAGVAALQAVMDAFGRDPRAMPAIRAHQAVVSALRADPAALPDVVRRTGREVTLRSDPSLPAMTWMLEKDHG